MRRGGGEGSKEGGRREGKGGEGRGREGKGGEGREIARREARASSKEGLARAAGAHTYWEEEKRRGNTTR